MQILTGFTTNEKMNYWRYKYLRSESSSPFSFGWKQNLADLCNRRLFSHVPTSFDWTRIYSVDDFYDVIPTRLKRSAKPSLNNSTQSLFNV